MGGKRRCGHSRGSRRGRRHRGVISLHQGGTQYVGMDNKNEKGNPVPEGDFWIPCEKGLTLGSQKEGAVIRAVPAGTDKAKDLSDTLEWARLCECSNYEPGAPELKIAKGDFHTWIEDKEGNIVFDPWFLEYDLTKELRGIDKDAKQVHYKFVNQEKCAKLAMKSAIERSLEFSAMFGIGGVCAGQHDWIEGNWGLDHPRHGFCNLNCFNHMKKVNGKDKGYKIVVGAMGWEEDGSVHLEYG